MHASPGNFSKLDTLRCMASEAIFEPKTSLQVFALVWVLFQATPFQEHVATMLKSACSQVTAAFFYVWTVKFAQARLFGEDMHVCCMQVRVSGCWICRTCSTAPGLHGLDVFT